MVTVEKYINQLKNLREDGFLIGDKYPKFIDIIKNYYRYVYGISFWL